jgi:hypothetical protein
MNADLNQISLACRGNQSDESITANSRRQKEITQ